MPSGSTRLTVTFLYSLPSTVLKSSARTTGAKQTTKMKTFENGGIMGDFYRLGWTKARTESRRRCCAEIGRRAKRKPSKTANRALDGLTAWLPGSPWALFCYPFFNALNPSVALGYALIKGRTTDVRGPILVGMPPPDRAE